MNEMGGSMQSTGAIDAVRIGSKWVGDRYPCYIIAEIGINGPLPAVANAIYDACGVRMKKAPFTPERVLAAILSQK